MHTKRLIVVAALSLICVLLSSWPVALAAAPQAGNLFVVSHPLGLAPACAQSDPCGLRSAVNTAVDGDTIYIAAGTYASTTDAVVMVTKNITLYGGWNGAPGGPIVRAPDHYKSILNGQGARQVVYISGTVTPTLDGLWITNGSSGYGGGIYAQNASPIIRACRIYSNSASSGGGVYLLNGPAAQLVSNYIYSNTSHTGGGFSCLDSPGVTLTGNQIYSNVVLYGSGGGIGMKNCPLSQLSNNIIRNNDAVNYGGGLHIEESPTTTLTHNEVHHNVVSQQAGGGIYLRASPAASLTDNEIYSNTAWTNGGGLYLSASALAVVLNNRIYGNTAFDSYHGGGIYLITSPATTLAHNQVYQNQAHAGGGIYLQYGITGTTVADNEVYSNTANSGGGFYLSSSSGVTLTGNLIRSNRVISSEGGGLFLIGTENINLLNNVLLNNQLANSTGCGSGLKFYEASASLWHTTVAGNTGGTGAAICLDRTPSSVAMTNTIIASQTVGIKVTWHNTATLNGVLWYDNGDNFTGIGQISVIRAITGAPAFAADGYHLTMCSAAINAGVAAGVTDDIDGDLRPTAGAADLGADEYISSATCKYVYLPSVLK